MMELAETPVQATTYSIISSLECVENYEVVQYGIEQIYFGEDGEKVMTKVKAISDEKEIVMQLIRLLDNEQVHPCNLIDVVEDYITEVHMM